VHYFSPGHIVHAQKELHSVKIMIILPVHTDTSCCYDNSCITFTENAKNYSNHLIFYAFYFQDQYIKNSRASTPLLAQLFFFLLSTLSLRPPRAGYSGWYNT
jgi:hypothetical protein